MAGIATDITVALGLVGRTLRRRLHGEVEPAPDLDAFRARFDEALAGVEREHVARCEWITLPATEPPWRDTGIDLQAGHEVTIFCAGRVYASKALDIWVTPKNQIWTRVGATGSVRSSSRASQSFEAEETGRLFLGNCFPNDWSTREGERLQDDRVYRGVSGETRIAIVEWNGSARDGLEALVAAGDPDALASGELERLSGAGRPPEGWHYLWHLGEGEMYRAHGAGAIDCEVEGDVGILQKPVDFPFAPGCRLEWDWQVDALPGTAREDTLPSHDYLSIAVEFDHGWDITYYWSTALEPETGYVCPLPNWKHREYHVVVRKGEAGLGALQSEGRDLYVDHAEHLAAHAPEAKRIVGIWLIANSVFARQRGACRFENIRLVSGDRELKVL
ncbi:MAG: DUF3047 domain-containing protein [Myxococcota bacterium]|jgi:hypothetical protein|nr:DUF3047 domain-containing protein [Myxococcota bacterium]